MERMKESNWSKSDWLERSLSLFVREGTTQLSLSRLTDEFGRTKGSFYWHFRDVADFRAQLVEHWHEVYTVEISRVIDEIEGGPAEQLKQLLQTIVCENLGRFHRVMESLIATNPELEPAVTKSLEFRRRYVRKLFAAIGFSTSEAQVRASIILGYGMAEGVINRSLSRKKRLALANEVCELVTKRNRTTRYC
jgi:AcrR family transcriptional regulator